MRFMPTQEHIREECARIQAGWSSEERAKRWVRRSVTHLSIRVVDTSLATRFMLGEDLEEIHKWPFLEDGEQKKKKRKEKPAEQLEDIVEEYEPVTITFGKRASHA